MAEASDASSNGNSEFADVDGSRRFQTKSRTRRARKFVWDDRRVDALIDGLKVALDKNGRGRMGRRSRGKLDDVMDIFRQRRISPVPTVRQVRSKRDAMEKDYAAWCWLVECPGVARDGDGNVVIDDVYWDDLIVRRPAVRRFRRAPLYREDDMHLLFADLDAVEAFMATGVHWPEPGLRESGHGAPWSDTSSLDSWITRDSNGTRDDWENDDCIEAIDRLITLLESRQQHDIHHLRMKAVSSLEQRHSYLVSADFNRAVKLLEQDAKVTTFLAIQNDVRRREWLEDALEAMED